MHGYIINNLLIWSDTWAMMMSRRMMSSFSSSSFVASTTTTAKDDAEVPTEGSLEEEKQTGKPQEWSITLRAMTKNLKRLTSPLVTTIKKLPKRMVTSDSHNYVVIIRQ